MSFFAVYVHVFKKQLKTFMKEIALDRFLNMHNNRQSLRKHSGASGSPPACPVFPFLKQLLLDIVRWVTDTGGSLALTQYETLLLICFFPLVLRDNSALTLSL